MADKEQRALMDDNLLVDIVGDGSAAARVNFEPTNNPR